METIKNDLDGTLVILFEPGEKPDIPSGYEIVERTEPEYFRGLLNPGRIVCQSTPARISLADCAQIQE